MVRKTVYLASPLGFAESTRGFLDDLAGSMRSHVDVLNPWDNHQFDAEFGRLFEENDFAVRTNRLREINLELGRQNTDMIDRADAVLAVLDGVDVDSGTASEIGYGFAKGKYVCGLRTDFRLSADNHGGIVNLQVEYFIRASGGSVVTTAAELVELARAFSQA